MAAVEAVSDGLRGTRTIRNAASGIQRRLRPTRAMPRYDGMTNVIDHVAVAP